MTKAVDNAAVVIPVLTAKYQTSANCRKAKFDTYSICDDLTNLLKEDNYQINSIIHDTVNSNNSSFKISYLLKEML